MSRRLKPGIQSLIYFWLRGRCARWEIQHIFPTQILEET